MFSCYFPQECCFQELSSNSRNSSFLHFIQNTSKSILLYAKDFFFFRRKCNNLSDILLKCQLLTFLLTLSLLLFIQTTVLLSYLLLQLNSSLKILTLISLLIIPELSSYSTSIMPKIILLKMLCLLSLIKKLQRHTVLTVFFL